MGQGWHLGGALAHSLHDLLQNREGWSGRLLIDDARAARHPDDRVEDRARPHFHASFSVVGQERRRLLHDDEEPDFEARGLRGNVGRSQSITGGPSICPQDDGGSLLLARQMRDSLGQHVPER